MLAIVHDNMISSPLITEEYGRYRVLIGRTMATFVVLIVLHFAGISHLIFVEAMSI